MALPGISNDAASIRTTGPGDRSANESVFRKVGSIVGSSGSSGGGNTGGNGQILQQQQVLQPVMVEQDIEEMIIEERNKDIQRLNHDLVLVNEMFKDMAEIVDRQGEAVETIHKTTEESHTRAAAGLEQVNKASELQPGCTIC